VRRLHLFTLAVIGVTAGGALTAVAVQSPSATRSWTGTTTTTAAATGDHIPAGAFYVSPTGSDGSPGTRSQPWRTLRFALDSLRPGDTLVVRGGTYREQLGGTNPLRIAHGAKGKRIVVEAYPGERPVLRGLLWLDQPSYWTLDGLGVTWPSGASSTEQMVKITNGVGWRLTNMEIWGAHSYADVLVAGTAERQPAFWRIDHSCIHDTVPSNGLNQDHNLYVNTGVTAGSGSVDHDVLFGAHNGENVKIGGPTVATGSADVIVDHDTFGDATQPLLVSGSSHRITIVHNLVAEARRGVAFRGYALRGTGVVARDNLGLGSMRLIVNDGGSRTGIRDGGGNMVDAHADFETAGCGGIRLTDRGGRIFGAG
jgi:hypothetical protein